MGVRPARLIDQAGAALDPEALPPPPRGGARDAHLRGHVRDRTTRGDALDHDEPAGRRQSGISVRHERPPWSESVS